MSGAPATGYDFGNKRHYRRSVWNFLESRFPHTPLRDRTAFILDTQEGLETKFLIERGYNPDNIHVANENPAILAHMTRSITKQYGVRVNTYGCHAAEAIQKAIYKHKVESVNLDLCGPMSGELAHHLEFTRTFLPQNTAIALTMLRGRERDLAPIFREMSGKTMPPEVRAFHQRKVLFANGVSMKDNDIFRFTCAVSALTGNYEVFQLNDYRLAFYRSTAGYQTMMIVLMHLERLVDEDVSQLIDREIEAARQEEKHVRRIQ